MGPTLAQTQKLLEEETWFVGFVRPGVGWGGLSMACEPSSVLWLELGLCLGQACAAALNCLSLWALLFPHGHHLTFSQHSPARSVLVMGERGGNTQRG